jgi:hypothetical protein
VAAPHTDRGKPHPYTGARCGRKNTLGCEIANQLRWRTTKKVVAALLSFESIYQQIILQFYDFGAFEAAGSVAGIYYQARMLHYPLVVVGAVVGDDDGGVGFFQQFFAQLGRFHVQRIGIELWYIGVVINDVGSLLFEQVDDINGGRFPGIVNILFISHTQYEEPGTVNALLLYVQGIHHLIHHKKRHISVYFVGQLHKAGVIVEGAQLPGEILRVNGYAVAAQAGSGVKGYITKGLGSRCLNYLPDVDVQFIAYDCDLINQSNVDAAEGVFQQLGHLCALGGGHRHNLINYLCIERARYFGALLGEAAYDLRRIVNAIIFISRVNALRGEGQVEIFTRSQASSLKSGSYHLIGGSRIGSALQDYQLTFFQIFSDVLAAIKDKRNVRIVGFIQRGGDTDYDNVN